MLPKLDGGGMKNLAVGALQWVVCGLVFLVVSRLLPHSPWLSFLLSIGIGLVLSFLIYWPLRPKPPAANLTQGADQITKVIDQLLVESREYRPAALADFPDVDTAWYEATTAQLTALRCTVLGDFIDIQHNEQNPHARAVMRAMASADGSVSVGMYHLMQRALARGRRGLGRLDNRTLADSQGSF